jgi:hypothetical protein
VKRDVDIDRFPIGCLVRTPSGRIGEVVKHRGTESKHDHFLRLVVHFGGGPRDSVVLQPTLLQPVKSPEPEETQERMQ